MKRNRDRVMGGLLSGHITYVVVKHNRNDDDDDFASLNDYVSLIEAGSRMRGFGLRKSGAE